VVYLTSVGIFSLGADNIQTQNMVDFVKKCSASSEVYGSEDILLKDAEKNRFSYVLVFDTDAFSASSIRELEKLDIKIFTFRHREILKQELTRKVVNI